MSRITFYRQERFDGGLRSGIDVDDTHILGTFVPGSGDDHPALLWYVDMQFEGESLPTDPDHVREWLLNNSDFIKQGLKSLAVQLQVGLDADEPWPVSMSLAGAPEGVTAQITALGVRRLAVGELAQNLIHIERAWSDIVSELQPLANV
jgi:hypothetical protein